VNALNPTAFYEERDAALRTAWEREDEARKRVAALSGLDRLKEAQSLYDALVVRKRREGGGSFREADGELNDATRELIDEFKLAHGSAFLVKVNRYNAAERAESPIRRWDGGLVYTFGASIIVPVFDAELERLLLEREAAATHKGDYARLQAIYARVGVLGGTPLFWS
jgi:hypothetical protein